MEIPDTFTPVTPDWLSNSQSVQNEMANGLDLQGEGIRKLGNAGGYDEEGTSGGNCCNDLQFCEAQLLTLEEENEVLSEDYCNSLSAFSVLTGIDSSGGYLTQQTGSACIKNLTPGNPCTPQSATILIGKRQDNTWELKYYSDGGFPNNRWIVQGPIPEGGSSRVPFLGPIVSGASGTLTIDTSDWLGIPLEIVAYYNPNPVPTTVTQSFGIFPLEGEQTTCE